MGLESPSLMLPKVVASPLEKSRAEREKENEMLKKVESIKDLNGVNNAKFQNVEFADLVPQTTTYNIGTSEEVELTRYVYFDDETNELIRPWVVVAEADEITFVIKEVWEDEDCIWRPDGILNWHFGCPDKDEWVYPPFKHIVEKEKDVILAGKVVQFNINYDGWAFDDEYGDVCDENIDKAIADTMELLGGEYPYVEEWLEETIECYEEDEEVYKKGKDLLEEVAAYRKGEVCRHKFLLVDSYDDTPYDVIKSNEAMTIDEMQSIITKLVNEYDTRSEQGYDGSDCIYEYVVWSLENVYNYKVLELTNFYKTNMMARKYLSVKF